MSENKTESQAAEVQLIYKSRIPASQRVQVKSSIDAFRVLWGYWKKETIEHHEELVALLMNNKNFVLGIAEISKGGVASTIIDPKIVFQYALKCHATGIILCHNHPSSDPTPSENDVLTTKKLIEAGTLLNIQVLDHLVISGDGTYYSLADEGRL
jgi:DNA repair protein RadC